MNKKFLISIILAVLFLLPAVMAYIEVPAPAPGVIQAPEVSAPGIVPSIMDWFNSQDSTFTKAWTFVFGGAYADLGPAFMVWLCMWLIIFVFIGDTLKTFSTLRGKSAWIIAGCIAMIGSVSGAVTAISKFVLGLTAVLGSLSIAVVTITSLLAVAFIHLGVQPQLLKWALNRQADIAEIHKIKAARNIRSTIRALDEMGDFEGV